MLEYLRYIKKVAHLRPRTYWLEFPFYIIINGAKQKFSFGYRPQDLAHLETIEKKALKKHQSYLNRLERFPLDKAEYYLRIKETNGITSIRSLAKITGEDWSYVARILKTLDLADPIKDYLKENKSDPKVVKFFHLRRLSDIVRQGKDRFQLLYFRRVVQEFEEEVDLRISDRVRIELN